MESLLKLMKFLQYKVVVFSYMSETSKPLDLMPDRNFRGFRALSRPMGTVFKEGEILNH